MPQDSNGGQGAGRCPRSTHSSTSPSSSTGSSTGNTQGSTNKSTGSRARRRGSSIRGRAVRVHGILALAFLLQDFLALSSPLAEVRALRMHLTPRGYLLPACLPLHAGEAGGRLKKDSKQRARQEQQRQEQQRGPGGQHKGRRAGGAGDTGEESDGDTGEPLQDILSFWLCPTCNTRA